MKLFNLQAAKKLFSDRSPPASYLLGRRQLSAKSPSQSAYQCQRSDTLHTIDCIVYQTRLFRSIVTFSFLNVPRGGGGSTSSCPYSETDMKGFFLTSDQCPAGRVFQYRVGSGRVLDKIPGSGSGSGRVGVSKNTMGYFLVSFLLSGTLGYFGYYRVCRVFLGLPIYTRVIL